MNKSWIELLEKRQKYSADINLIHRLSRYSSAAFLSSSGQSSQRFNTRLTQIAFQLLPLKGGFFVGHTGNLEKRPLQGYGAVKIYQTQVFPMKYPKWFPYPSSWLNAFLLCLLTALNAVVATVVIMTGAVMANMTNDPTLLLPVISLALLSPIGAIAIVHHIIHLFLSRYAPQLQAPEIGNVTGLWPKLMSWWEGIWGCAAMVIASVGTIFLGWVIQPMFNIDYQHLYRNSDSEQFGAALFIIWLTIAAYLYQCFQLVEHRLMVVARADRH